MNHHFDQMEANQMARVSADAILRERQAAGLSNEPREAMAQTEPTTKGSGAAIGVAIFCASAFVVIAVCYLAWNFGAQIGGQ